MKLLSTALLFICTLWMPALAQTFEWVNEGSGIGQDAGQRVTVDKWGNVFATGYFSGEATFNGTLYKGKGIFDVYVAKYTSSGELLWLKTAGGIQNDAGYGIDTDESGNVYVTGYFTQTIVFGDAASGTASLNSTGNTDIFLAKYDANGKFIWAKKAGGATEDRGNNLLLDSQKNIYITGYFSDFAYFGSHTVSGEGSTDVFIAKYDSTGNCLWVQGIGGSGLDKGFGLAIDTSDHAYITGFFYYDASLTNSAEVLHGDGLSSDIYIAKYDEDGNIIWARRLGGPYNDAGFGIAVDKEKSIFITGYFLEIATFGDFAVDAYGYNDVYIAKYDSTLKCEWAINEGGEHLDLGIDIALDNFGNVYVTGSYDSVGVFGNDTLRSVSYYDLFICKYSGKGILIWARDAGGVEGDFTKALSVDGGGTVYLTGYYKKNAVFGTIHADFAEETDIFIAKISQPVGITEMVDAGGFSVYPNPSTGVFYIDLKKLDGKPVNITIFDVSGKIISTLNNYSGSGIAVSLNQPPGIYFVRLESEKFSSIQRMVILNSF